MPNSWNSDLSCSDHASFVGHVGISTTALSAALKTPARQDRFGLGDVFSASTSGVHDSSRLLGWQPLGMRFVVA